MFKEERLWRGCPGCVRRECRYILSKEGTTVRYVLYAMKIIARIAYGVEIYAWVLMTNHIHLLATPDSDSGISRMMQYQGRCYVKYFNQMVKRSGTLWEGRFKSCVVDTQGYFFACQKVIELNPVRAKMVEIPAMVRWSSFNVHAHGANW